MISIDLKTLVAFAALLTPLSVLAQDADTPQTEEEEAKAMVDDNFL